jgi:hypothetical protein
MLYLSNQFSQKKIYQKNYVSYIKNVKKPKICMEATRRNLQAQPKILKKYDQNTKSTNQKENFTKKVCLVR